MLFNHIGLMNARFTLFEKFTALNFIICYEIFISLFAYAFYLIFVSDHHKVIHARAYPPGYFE